MKLISLGKIDKKFFIYIILYIINIILLGLVNVYFSKNKGVGNDNILIDQLIQSFCYIFFGIPEYILRKNENNKNKEKNIEIHVENNLIYLSDSPNKPKSYKHLLILIILLTALYIYIISKTLLFSYYPEYMEFASDESYSAIIMFFLYLIFRIIHKIIFYKHQYISLVILVSFGLIRVSIKKFYIQKQEFIFPDDLLSLIILIIYPIPYALTFYVPYKYMKYEYYSHFFICFISGLINIICSIITLSIFLSINCEETSIFYGYCRTNKNIKGYSIIIYIFQSILYALIFFMQMKILNDYTVFHIMLFFSITVFISNIFNIILDFNINDFILVIITFPFEIFFILVFVEIIELNFCGLNSNLKKNIIERGSEEIDSLFEEKDDNTINSESNLSNKSLNDSDSNSIY